FDMASVKAPLQHAPMEANAALAFVLAGTALGLRRGTPARDRAVQILAGIAAAIGAFTLEDQVLGVSLLALGVSIAIKPGHRSGIVGLLASLPIAIGILSLVDYGYGIRSLYGLVSDSAMAVHTAALLVIAGSAVLFARPDIGWVALVLSDGIGGTT